MEGDRWFLLGRLKRAVKKITFLINFNIINRLKLASMIGASSSNRMLSFSDRPGLRAVTSDSESDHGSGRVLQKTSSYSSEDDIDRRADEFIANFYKQLQLEKQLSLEVRYYRGNSFDSAKSP